MLSVNMAARQVREPGIVDEVATVLGETGWPAELLQLELTESALMGTPDGSLAALRALADMGVRIAIDDFGTGYSNLAYLRHLPVHTLKLAGPFVTGAADGNPGDTVASDEVDREVVGLVIRLAHTLGLTVTPSPSRPRPSSCTCSGWAATSARAGCSRRRWRPRRSPRCGIARSARLRRPTADRWSRIKT
jgi:hypothetical protein